MRIRKILTTRWMLDGKQVRARTPGAQKIQVESRKWYAVGPPLPRGRSVPLSTNRSVAQRLLVELEERLLRGESGLPDPSQLRRPLSEWLEEWRLDLGTSCPSTRQVAEVLARVQRAVAGCGWAVVGDLSSRSAAEWLASQRRRTVEPLSIQTSNHYGSALRRFGAWLVRRGVLQANPLAEIPRLNPAAHLRHARRALEPDQLAALLDSVQESDRLWRGLSGQDRYLLYLVAITTGYRRGELLSLRVGSFALAGTPPTVRLGSRRTKARRDAVQPIPRAVADLLATRIAGQPVDAPMWTWSQLERSAEMLAADLSDCGIPYVVDLGDGERYADFHSLRHTYITLLEQAGASVREAQELARHSDPRLTLSRYTHTRAQALASRVEQIPLPGLATGPTVEQVLLWLVCWAWTAWLVAAPVAAPSSLPADSGEPPYTGTGAQK